MSAKINGDQTISEEILQRKLGGCAKCVAKMGVFAKRVGTPWNPEWKVRVQCKFVTDVKDKKTVNPLIKPLPVEEGVKPEGCYRQIHGEKKPMNPVLRVA